MIKTKHSALASQKILQALLCIRSLSIALLSVLVAFSTQADELVPLWQLAPNDRTYVTGTNYTERGIAFNPATTNLLVVSRLGGLNVIVLDAATGAELRMLNVDDISGGTFALSMIGVSDDGVVYAANLSTSLTATRFKLYRWENDQSDSIPTIAFDGDPAGVDESTGASKNPQRWGDSLDVRGSGANTMVAVPSRASGTVAIFTTTDGVTFASTLITNAAVSAGSLGVAFGEGNTLWTKVNGQPLRHVSFDLATGQATLIKEFADPAFPSAIAPIGVNPAKKLLGGISIATPDDFRLFDISNLSQPPALIDRENFPADNANANFVGSVDFGTVRGTNSVFALDSNNGIVAYRVVSTPASPPVITTQPQSQIALEGGPVTFTVAASGTAPFGYQWQFKETNIASATNAALSITNLQSAAAGSYRAIVSNAAGSATSADAVLTVNRRVNILTPLWQLAPGDRPYINTDGTQRGIASNPLTGNLLLISRTGGTNIYVLDGATGKELRKLNVDPAIVSGGTFAVNMIGVADDGAVYACNLVTDSGPGQFSVYRWQNDSADTVPTVAFLGDPSVGNTDATNRRFGDSFDVRGTGANTQILLASRAGKLASLLATTDGLNFTATAINTDVGAGAIGLGVAFGAGNSFWGTAFGSTLRLIDFDVAAGTGTTRHNFGASDIPIAVSALAVDPAHNLLVGVALETPDNLRLYDTTDLTAAPVLVDQALFPTDNANVNGTGSADFGARGERLYAIDSNNGIVAYQVRTIVVEPPIQAILSAPSRLATGAFEFSLRGTVGASYVIQATADFTTWNALSTNLISAPGTIRITDAAAATESKRFYRAMLAR
jgi:hypothetical protein